MIKLNAIASAMLLCLAATSVAAGPLHDSFLEQFQVGTWSQPDEVVLLHSYPEALLAPATLDTAWTGAAAAVLDGSLPGLTLRLSSQLPSGVGGESWLAAARTALADLTAGRVGDPAVGFLRAERLTMAFGAATAARDYARASEVALQMTTAADAVGLSARDRLVWSLRQQLTSRLAGNPAAPDAGLWPEVADLEPFDTGNAWVLWVAHRRSLDRPVLPTRGDQAVLGKVLGQVPKAWVGPAELYASGLDAEWQAGLGGVVLPTAALAAHFERFATPPSNFERQGWWVQGLRRMKRGEAAAYEEIAARTDLSPGWRLDVWRRASELRLLRGQWPAGLADLDSALKLAAAGHGTVSLRQRLREWAEQALVLALAQNDADRAGRVHELALAAFQGEEGEAYVQEVATWRHRIDPRAEPGTPAGTDILDLARHQVSHGQAPLVQPAGAPARSDFLAAADRPLWPVWYKWGVALADTAAVTGDRRARAASYLAALHAGQRAADKGGALVDSALAAVALRFADRPWLDYLLRKAVDVDAGRLCGWQTPPSASPVPQLLPMVRGSELDRHALLGFCLAAGDMRGILGLAFELPGKGLTRTEKRLFLYPFPAVGPIREALAAADNDPALLLAVARNESLFEPAVRSRAGALGWMQIMPFHYPERGAVFGPGNWRIPAVSIRRGDGLLTENRVRYQGDAYRVLAAYNAGPESASRWDTQLGGKAAADIYLAWIGYAETRAYVEKVLIDRGIYTAIIGAVTGASQTAVPNE